MENEKVIVWTNPELGNVCVCYPTGELPVEALIGKDTPANAKIVSKDALPANADDFFDAWRLNDAGKIVVDMGAARDIHRNRLRVARAPKLADLDVQFQRAMEEDADTSAIIAAKRVLRDLTKAPEIEAAADVAELRAFWPAVLL